MISRDIQLAKKILESNELVSIPTETVYGLAGNAFQEEAVKKIYALKNRPLYNPLIVHIRSIDYLSEVATDIPEVAYDLAKEFWPGPLTMVLQKKSNIPDLVTSKKDTVAVRMPNHPLTLKLLEAIDFPLVAPSANPFGSISPTTAEHVDRYFKDDLKMVLDGGPCERGIESTIIGFEHGKPVIYRLGSLAIEDIEKKTGPLFTKNNNDSSPQAPGMLSRHYAPVTETILTDDIPKTIKKYLGKKIGVLVFKDQQDIVRVDHTEILSKTGDFKEAAKNLYAAMHRLDHAELDVIIAEKLPETGLGTTLNDKLRRATKK